jgi:hypothetical protein
VVTASARPDRGAALPQHAPLPVAVDQDTSLIEDPVQKKRSSFLHPFQVGDINLTAAGSFQADSQLDANRGTILSEQDQQVEIRVGILVAPRQRAIEHGKTNALLSPQRPAKTGEKRPMSAEILTLTRRKPQPPRSTPTGAQSALRDGPAQRALLDIEVNRQLL